MLNIFARASVARITDPVGGWLVRRGLSPNTMTVLGTAGTIGAALWFLPRGDLFVGAAVVTVFVLFDLLDGAMARVSGGSTVFGAVLDSCCDRLADAALFGAIAYWCFVGADDRVTGIAALVSLGCGQVISYIKARAEASGLSADGGLVERAERLIIGLVGVGVHGLGVPYILQASLWLLAVLSVITVVQRLLAVHRSASEQAA
ncbi:CDP-diacylglycerol--glycerol-3-phosphate 3-phosphatidyltransferase [Actinoalloteichus hoggarensis]|uniref:Phosphatidylinositol phosphate synthase n=1 Tax=Actinoalloteichus hoggarensis TaxID=1470176 RepID=A0A221W1V5_9PSEU|nr:CDP-alcohol phosphatidyltransferase family protein [Actinoalloteichus hoggarensis]ASO19663.1 CDP-diacylglycerol--inositol 3-phosphatidyltransferase [Actinoalloteichus hoggarensis]MBB5919630.1 CDP-diacylglycerol--glycerol-3-phosphate 3-phosphatidyltransferase [Actinoalloteichus hoggarensis]